MAQISVKDKLTKAKAKAIMTAPFFASLICRMPVIEDDTINPPTMCTNGQYIKYHPKFVSEISVDEVLFVLCHEVMHGALQHMFRRGQRHPVVWNIAADYVINDLLIKEGIGSMPQLALHDPNKVQAGGGTTDGVYNIIYQEMDGGGNGKGPGLPDQWDNCEDAQGSEAEKAQAEAEWKVAVQQAANAAKMCGKLGGSLERFVSEALRPKVDWKSVLRRFVSTRAKVDRSYARPRRRFLADGLYLPGLTGEMLGEIVLAVDCSGSISGKEIDEFAAELIAIKQDMHPSRMHVLYFHDGIAKHDIFEREDELVIAPNGTGGTAFSPIFAHLVEKGIEPACTVVLTDLCCNDFGDDPGHPVLWCSTHGTKAPFGEVVMMHDKH
jgi:predicted metal-dependent peptidase